MTTSDDSAAARRDIMPGVSHDSVAASNRTRDFFLDVLQGRFPET